MTTTRLEVLTTPKLGLGRDDVLAAVVSVAGTVTRSSAKDYRNGLVSVVFTVSGPVDVEAVRRAANSVSATAPEVSHRVITRRALPSEGGRWTL